MNKWWKSTKSLEKDFENLKKELTELEKNMKEAREYLDVYTKGGTMIAYSGENEKIAERKLLKLEKMHEQLNKKLIEIEVVLRKRREKFAYAR